MRKAENDLVAAQSLLASKPPLHDIVCFHCQQAAEKYLKSLLSEESIVIPRTHDLTVLLNLLVPKHPGLVSLRRRLTTVTQFAVEYRYPGSSATQRQARAAVATAKLTRKAVRTILGLA